MNYFLGLDLGETSVGWAILEVVDDMPRRIEETGVRIFPAGADVDEKRGSSETSSQTRRQKRAMRRNIGRRRKRKERLRKDLIQAGLWPADKQEKEKLIETEPYALRVQALDEKLPPYEIGRILIHLNMRRGFKSNRKSDDKKESGQIAARAAALNQDMADKGARTLGEYFHMLNGDEKQRALHGEALRNRQGRYERHQTRQMVEDEFNAIWEAQAAHHPDLLTPELHNKLHEDIFFQQTFALTPERRAMWPKGFVNAKKAPQLAKCPLFHEEVRSKSGTWLGQRFRLLKEINNIRVLNHVGEPRELSAGERSVLLEELGTRVSMNFNAMRKLLGFPEDYTFNLEAGKRNGLKGNEAEVAIIKALFGSKTAKTVKQWRAMEEIVQHDIRWAVEHIEEEGEFHRWGQEHDLTDDQVNALMDVTPTSGYLAYSEKALEILVPLMEDGRDEYRAIVSAVEQELIPRPKEMEVVDKLSIPPDIPNPVVRRALFETRKVVNSLIREYGKPQKITVELARELKFGPVKRQEQSQRRQQNEDRNRKARDWYVSHGRPDPSRADLIKWKLWEDQKHKCAYTNQAIGAEMFLSDARPVEVDHILPFSRSLDDSYENKVLCMATANRDKSNRTPVEWLGGDGSEAYDGMMVWLQGMSLSKGKLGRFRQASLDQGEMIARQLVDSQYIAREVSKYLACLYPTDMRVGQKAIWTVPGRITARLRHFWGVNTILGPELDDQKNRSDHRHHALDAVVVACANRKHMRQLGDTAQRSYHERDVDPPWPTFRDDLDYMATKRERTWMLGEREVTTKGIVVSHRPDRKIRGGFHDGTNYGPTKEDPTLFVYRKRVDSLTWPMIDRIVNDTVRAIVIAHLAAQGIEAGDKIPPKAWESLPHMKTKSDKLGPPIRRVRIHKTIKHPHLFEDKHNPGHTQRAVETGNNHHLEIVEATQKGKPVWLARSVTTLEAAKRVRQQETSIVQRQPEDDAHRFVMSLCKKDMVVLRKDGEDFLCVLRKISGAPEFSARFDLELKTHLDATPLTAQYRPIGFRISSSQNLQSLDAVKVNIDPIGRLSLSND